MYLYLASFKRGRKTIYKIGVSAFVEKRAEELNYHPAVPRFEKVKILWTKKFPSKTLALGVEARIKDILKAHRFWGYEFFHTNLETINRAAEIAIDSVNQKGSEDMTLGPIYINPDPWYKTWGWKAALGIAFAVLFYFAFHVSPEQIAACVEHTGWSEARCQVELTR